MKKLPTDGDVLVIGGGPAGMMAAATAAAGGARVVLLEKNLVLGKKLLISGGGRCNVTNHKPVVREMLSKYKAEGKFLFSTFMQHGVAQTIEWFADRDVPFVEENEGRLFPSTEKAETIKQALVAELTAQAVTVRPQSVVTAITVTGKQFVVTLADGSTVAAPACVVATGGIARPETGSTGEGFDWLKSLGHTIVPNSYALVPLALKTLWTKSLSGITIPDCQLTINTDGKKHNAARGKLLFTHVGITGPTILNMSKTVGELLQYSSVMITVDLFPDKDLGALDDTLQQLLTDQANKKIRNALGTMVPTALGKAILGQCGIDGESQCNSVTRTSRKALGHYLKAIPLPVKGLLSKDKAVVSAGGVKLEEVDFKTMESRIVPGLFLVGDVLNINRPSGGYSLQLCWSTGYVAGAAVAKDSTT